MTKREAQAILAASRKILAARKSVLKQLSPTERNYAEAYWAGTLQGIATGLAYGGMPIAQAERVLNGEG